MFIDLTSELIGLEDFEKEEGLRKLSKAGGGKGGVSSSKGSSKAGGFSKGNSSAASVAIGTVRGPNGEEQEITREMIQIFPVASTEIELKKGELG